MEKMFQHEQDLLHYAEQELHQIEGLHMINSFADKKAVISFYTGNNDVKLPKNIRAMIKHFCESR